MESSIGIALTSLDNEVLTVDKIEKFNEITLEWFEKHNMIPTYWSVRDKKRNSKFSKFSLKKFSNIQDHKQYLDKDGDLILGLSFVVNPEGSDGPSYDNFCNFSIDYTNYSKINPNFKDDRKRFEIAVLIDPNRLSIKPTEIGWLLNKFTKLFQVDYGMVYLHDDYKHVSAEIIGYSDGKYEGRKKELTNWWYELSHEDKLHNLRDIYLVNILRKENYAYLIEKLINSDRKLFQYYTQEDNKKLFNVHAYKGNMVKIDIDDKSLSCVVEKNVGLKFFQ